MFRFCCAWGRAVQNKPPFADAHLFADFKKNMNNVSKRNTELAQWAQKLLDLPGDAVVRMQNTHVVRD